ncbi:uncharacterized protein METZ01_LOCUS317316, partial [marine metagenome]
MTPYLKQKWIWVGVFSAFVLIVSLCIWGVVKASTAKSSVDKWAESPGTSGFINLDEVQKSCLDSNNSKTENFEKRINEIFEGDNLILLDVQGRERGFLLSAIEDLNKNEKPDLVGTSGDEVVFQLEVLGSGPNNAKLTGKGVNSDFKSTFTYPMPNIDRASADNYYRTNGYYPYYYSYYGYRGYRYYTPRRRYRTMMVYRRGYRSSSRYRTQIISNGRYYGNYRTRYPSSSRTFSRPSASRKSYVSRTASSPGFKSRLSSSPTAKARSSLAKSGKISSSSKSKSSGGFKSGLSSTARSSSSRSSSSRSSSSRS